MPCFGELKIADGAPAELACMPRTHTSHMQGQHLHDLRLSLTQTQTELIFFLAPPDSGESMRRERE